jgi:RNA polymerase primary sigma factor
MTRIANKKIGNIKTKVGGFVEKTIVNDGFVQDLRRIKPITAQEEKEMFKAIEESKARVEAAKGSDNYLHVKAIEEKIQIDIKNEIISRNQYLNYAIAKQYNNTDIVMDLVSEGTIGMMTAFDKYDYTQGVRFCTYATYYIRRAIHAYVTKDNLMIRTSNDTKLISKVKKIEDRFFATEGRYPTTSEIKDILAVKYDMHNVDDNELAMANISSIDASITDGDDTFIVEEKSVEYNTKTAAYNDVENYQDLEAKRNVIDFLLDKLPKRERTIMAMSTGYGFYREYTDDEIGVELDLTRERVRQLRIDATKKLQSLAAATR